MFRSLLIWTGIAAAVGILSGSAAALFLWSLEAVTNYRSTHPVLIFALPFVGFVVSWAYMKFGRNSGQGSDLLLDEFHESKGPIPFRMTPFILIGSVLTHLCGGSTGREGTAIQMGGSLADQITRFFKFDHKARQILLLTGFSSGFAAVFGTPLAGTIFGFEFVVTGALFRADALYPALLAALIGSATTKAWGIYEHSYYTVGAIPDSSWQVILSVLAAGIVFGGLARLFSMTLHGMDHLSKKWFGPYPRRTFFGGVIFIGLFAWPAMQKYWGLSQDLITNSFTQPLPWYDGLLKTLATAVTIGSGFKGGEVTPLFLLGATSGNALSQILPLSMPLLAGLGFVSVFAGAANAPLACTVMAMELFGAPIGPLAALACVTSFLFSGNSGIYSKQRMGFDKGNLSAPEDFKFSPLRRK